MTNGLKLAVLALCVSGAAGALVAIETAEAHTDEWCGSHFLGGQASDCVQNFGCCYDGRIGNCHSCDAHTDEWCGTYGTEADICIGFSGCTYDYTNSACISNSDPSTIVDDPTCEEALATATANGGISTVAETAATYSQGTANQGGTGASATEVGSTDLADVTYVPVCTDDGLFELEQCQTLTCGPTDVKWCADENGHEISGTRMQSAQFDQSLTNCAKERRKHEGFQCPNAVTLLAANGVVITQGPSYPLSNANVGDCDVECNTDEDCRASQGEWCCYNGCGYACMAPILPLSSCDYLDVDPSITPVNADESAHGAVVTLTCSEGYSGAADQQITCRHGNWDKYEMTCYKDCPEYVVGDYIPGARSRDYIVKKGKILTNSNGANGEDPLINLHNGAYVKVRCQNGYGAIDGTLTDSATGETISTDPATLLTFEQKLKCVNGAWRTFQKSAADPNNPTAPRDETPIGPQSLVCSACFDTESGNWNGGIDDKGWWEGRARSWMVCDHDNDSNLGPGAANSAITNPLVSIANGVEPTPDKEWYCDVGTQREDSRDCTYFASRPADCASSPGALENCRVSCRTCEEKLLEYVVKNTRVNKNWKVVDDSVVPPKVKKVAVNHPTKWIGKNVRKIEGFQKTVTVERRVAVKRFVKRGSTDLSSTRSGSQNSSQ